MNFHSVSRKPWTNREQETFERLHFDCIPRREIASIMGRSEKSIMSRVTDLNRGIQRAMSDARPVNTRPFIEIDKWDLPAWYERGWVVKSFTGRTITLEWPHKGLPGALA